MNGREALEREILSLEGEIEEAARKQQELGRQQQHLNQELQEWSDRQSLRRAEIQRQIAALEPEKQARFSSLTAKEAKLNGEMQRLGRDGTRHSSLQTMSIEDRIDGEEQVQSQLDQLATERAHVDNEFATRSAELQDGLARLDIEVTEKNADRNQADRLLQDESNELGRQIAEKQREMERVQNRLKAKTDEEAAAASGSEAERLAAAKAREMERELALISEDRDRLAGEVKDLAPLVDAQRDATSAQGAENLGSFYSESAERHRKAWIGWLIALLLTVVAAAYLGLLTVDEVAPKEDPDMAEIFHSTAVALLVIGLLLYVVRVASLQFRVHRNLEAVDRSKAAALRTYSRIVAAANSPDVRNALVSSLADAVFRTPETGFIDKSADHITLVERIAGSAAGRVNGSSS